MLLLLVSTVCVRIMDKVNFNCSLKNIPLPSKQEYLTKLINSVSIFISTLSWRAFHFLNPSNSNQKETYGLKTTEAAPSVAELKSFENDMYELVKNVNFKKIRKSNLQHTLDNNIRNMNRDNRVYVPADKTRNFYPFLKDDYENMLLKNITKEYKKSKEDIVKKVNLKDKELAETLEIDNRVYSLTCSDAFVTVKDHKENFENNTKCRLINPAKPDLGKVSKKILTRIVTFLRKKTKFNQWKNSFSVIDWFNNIQDKANLSFIQFDIVEFYPSISENLLKEALKWAENMVDISAEEIKIILDTKKSILFNNNQAWVKKGNKLFNVTMGSFDGAEVAELVGLFLLSKLSCLNLNIGLYRDDGLAVCKLKPRQAELTRKKLCNIFQEYGLRITSTANVKNVNFLDINMDLQRGIHKPYMKPNDQPIYVDVQSNHPKSIIQNIPLSVNKRLSMISSNKEVFDAAAPPYQEALRNSGHNFQLNYTPTVISEKRRKRQRRIVYFNPPFSLNVRSNIGADFLRLIDKHFPKSNPLSKIINRNTVKVSYSCMPNLKQKVSQHNKKVRRPDTPQPTEGCNCTSVIGKCPLNGNCLTSGVIYRAEVVSDNYGVETYTGLTKNTFKKRFYKHRESFNKRSPETSTTLSSYIWQLKDRGEDYSVNWSIIDKGAPFNPATRVCGLCNKEKYYIIFEPDGASLNKRSELFSTCRHRRQKLLCNLES